MTDTFRCLDATPVLASLDIPRSVRFFVDVLGFTAVWAEAGTYGIVASGPVEVHFWACPDPALPGATSCRIGVAGIDALHARCVAAGVVHPRGSLERKPWGRREFAITDIDGNLVTFHQRDDDDA